MIVGDTGSQIWTWLQNYLANAWNTISENATRYYGLGIIASLFSGYNQLLVLFVLAASALLALVTVLIGYSYIIFAQIAISILTLFGPLFIPWMVFGRSRSCSGRGSACSSPYSLYAAVAAAIFRVMMQLIMVIGNEYQANADPVAVLAALSDPAATAWDIVDFIAWTVSFVLALFTCLLATFKIPEIAGGLVSGSAPGGGVAGAAITTGAAVKGGAAATRIAGKATGG